MKRALHKARYLLRSAFGDVFRAPLVHALAALTVALALFLAGLFTAVLANLATVLQQWGADVQVAVYLGDGASEAVIAEAVGRELGVAVQVISRAQAMERLRQSLGELASALDGMDEGVLPASVEARPPARMPMEEVRAAAGRIAALPGVSEVDWGQEWIERLQALLGLVRAAGAVLGGLVLVAAVLLVSAAIQLAVYARREEIEIMKLVGATDWFVRTPFLIEGFVQGLVGAAVATGGLALLNLALAGRVREVLAFAAGIQEVRVLSPQALGMLVVGGALVGLAGSAIAVARFLRSA